MPEPDNQLCSLLSKHSSQVIRNIQNLPDSDSAKDVLEAKLVEAWLEFHRCIGSELESLARSFPSGQKPHHEIVFQMRNLEGLRDQAGEYLITRGYEWDGHRLRAPERLLKVDKIYDSAPF